ncbi:MAG: histidine phosphatase family protein [Cyclobacteriaceae bacterium]
MQRKKIYLIRHGQTEYNRKGVVQGSGIDAPLNETGFMQAEAFYRAYEKTPFQKVYTSVLQRSIQSVDGFLKKGLPHTPLSGLNEISWGVKEGKVANANDHEYYASIVKAWQQGELDKAIEGGESPLMVQARQKEALQHILAQEDEELILICMHGRAMRIILCLMLGYDLSRMDEFEHANLGLYLLNYDYGHQKFELETANDLSHLSDLPPLSSEEGKP